MTTPDLPAGRPIPDRDDLRLLAELINNVSIPLVNAAWNARMSQSEAALRLVSMAERGLPLRLVADGDRQVLWHIAQAGPATSGVPVTGGSAPIGPASVAGPTSAAGPTSVGGPAGVAGPASAAAPASAAGPAGAAGPVGPPSAGSPSSAVPAPPVGAPPGVPGAAAAPRTPVVLPPTPAVPPHEQAIAGAVPLGEPPFGSPDPALTTGPGDAAPAGSSQAPGQSAEHAPGQSAEPPDSASAPLPVEDPGALWGPAGSSSWARVDDVPDGGPAPAPTDAAPSDAAPTDAAPGADRAPAPGADRAPVWESRTVAGPAGEQLVVRILDVTDPGDQVLTDAGYRMEPGERAVLVHSSVQNTGQVHYYPIGDLFLVLESDQGVLLGKASVAVASHPAHPVGVAPGSTADGWSVFLIPSETVVTGIKWCIRPDIPQTIVSWPIVP